MPTLFPYTTLFRSIATIPTWADLKAEDREEDPAVIVEIKERNRAAVENWFERIGYRQRPLSELAGVPGSAENFIFLPR